MGKIRINDLARELEVKSRAILDALLAVGFLEKKTHSSAVDEDVAEKVRRYLRGGAMPAAAPAAPSLARPATPAAAASTLGELPEVTATEERVEAAPPAKASAQPPATPRPGLRPAPAMAPEAPKTPPKMPVAPQRPIYRAPSQVHPAPAPASTSPASPASAAPAPPAPPTAPAPAPAAPRPTAPVLRPATPVAPFKPFVPAGTPAPHPAAAPAARPAPTARRPQLNFSPSASTPGAPPPATPTPGRRLIVPVATTRPTYSAPPPVHSTHPVPGRPIAGPAPGQPIYRRPAPAGARPGVPRPGVVPEGRRPMHPTRPGAGRNLPPRGAHYGRHDAHRKEGAQRFQPSSRPLPTGPVATATSITISEGITVKELSERLGLRARDVIRKLLDRGLMVTVNQSLDTEIATQIARDFGAEAQTVSFEQEALGQALAQADASEAAMASDAAAASDSTTLRPRAPVVTIMGHVDHGKTSLLDAIRLTSVAAGEAGGITQHIGAYKIQITDPQSPAFGREVVFIDTPGHAAFTRMRARGAKVTDIVVLVVAADDGVMPQTLEAIDHAKAAGVPIVVAINKIDKPDAQPDRVKKQLGDRGLLAEDWGGTTVMVNVSAKAKINLNLLLEMILLVSDLQELRADPERPAQGVVLEAQLDRGRGPVARILVQNGTLRAGDTIILGSVMGRVRAMFDDRGAAIDTAGPSTPVEVLGLDGMPDAGDTWLVVNDRSKAKQIVDFREGKAREATLARSARLNLEALSQQLARGDVKELNLIVKADMQGSVEVLNDSINKLSTEKVKVRIIHSGVGAITENDVLLASASHAVVIGFNVRPERKAADLAEKEKVDIRPHAIIYELTDEIKRAMHGLLEPTFKENSLGRAEVQQTFRIPKVGTIAGCIVKEGKLVRDAQVRVLRDSAVVHTGKLSSLRRFKDDASEVRVGMECGVSVANFSDIKPGDIIEAFTVEKVAPMMA
ncbi:MAG TPA: translation initiation factor IF-2 [Terriglobales bacterium]|jgi:translation initiation factor IF-2